MSLINGKKSAAPAADDKKVVEPEDVVAPETGDDEADATSGAKIDESDRGAADTGGKSKSILSSNSMLQEIEDKVENSLTPDTKAAYNKIVVAGNKAGLQGGETGILARLRDVDDPISAAGKGAAGLVLILRKESKDSMPINAMILGGTTLMLHALDFVQRANIADVGPNEIATATKAYTNTIFKALGITPQMLIKGNESVQKAAQDPAIMEQMRRKAGLVKAPGTSTPTEVPEGDPNAV